MDGSGGMRSTRFAPTFRCDLSSHVLIGNAEVRAHAGFRSTGPAGEKRHRRARHTAQKAATLDGHPVHGNRVPRSAFRGMKLRYGPDQTDPYRKSPPLPLAPIPFHRNAL